MCKPYELICLNCEFKMELFLMFMRHELSVTFLDIFGHEDLPLCNHSKILNTVYHSSSAPYSFYATFSKNSIIPKSTPRQFYLNKNIAICLFRYIKRVIIRLFNYLGHIF